ncbi:MULTISPECIES: type I glyceraldehyde-3-phosphate dehydrogenase [unclassified Nocardioides]|uniref:type I glyceraldehyde-3-phosphate dehydrogenase n=1 Tax=unclassified Nocardioides TaxID=2615069 RepID=UPI000056FA62|nr:MULTISPECIES: type I glyceraldehyde-3-phosphate dehydrogenase [unclassified Nocardioides]ABL79454.1 Glyceraldehyde-3-phosphate dehydrogenase (phosphorylating) [Nocardioides sp. JS614]
MSRVAINGLGRIGRAALKLLLEFDDLDVVAVNDLADIENLAYLIRYDTVYGRYHREVACEADALIIDGREIRVLAEADPANLPWRDLNVDLVLECTGVFRHEDDLRRHIQAGASFVVLSAPTTSEAVPTVVHGVNAAHGDARVISCASCTTNCITPIVEVARRRLAAERAVMTTVHAYTATQHLVDGPSKTFRQGRAGAVNLVPASTGAARATISAVPQLAGRFDGIAIRVPIPVGSIADIVFVAGRSTTADEVNEVFRHEALTSRYQGILGVSEDPLVSADIIGDSRAAVLDTALTRVVDGTLVKVMAWYDNEWGFTNQMIREVRAMLGLRPSPTRPGARPVTGSHA